MWKAVFLFFCLTCVFFKAQVWHLRSHHCSFTGQSEASNAHEIAKTAVVLFEKFKKHLIENDSLVLLCSTALPDNTHEILPWPAVWNPSVAFPPLLWPAWPASETLADTDQRGRAKHSLIPVHFNNTGSANGCANLEEPDKLSTLLRCHNAVDSPLTEGKQVPLPQSTNDPIISIRSHDWCYTPLLLLSSSPHIQAPPQEPPGLGSTCPLEHSRSLRRGWRRLWSRIWGLNENH